MAYLSVTSSGTTLRITVSDDKVLEGRARRLQHDFERAGGSWFANEINGEEIPRRLVWVPASALIEFHFDANVPFSLGDICEDVDIEGSVRRAMRDVDGDGQPNQI